MPAAENQDALARRFRLVELTQDALKRQTKVDDFHQWGAPALDQAQYQQKEALQRATRHSQRGSVFWALVARSAAHENDDVVGSDHDVRDDDLVAGETEIVCHCESHAFDVAFRDGNGQIVRGLSHNIGSVFTLPAHRGHGLARFFLKAVQARLATKPSVLGSALYSDIGPTFYDSLGWRLYESTDATLQVAAPRNTSETEEDVASPMQTLLLDDALDELLQRDNARVVNDMASPKYRDKEVLASLLTRDSVEWQFCLGVFYATLRGFEQAPTQTGVYIDDNAFLVWCHNLKESTLYVQHARIPVDRPEVTVRLLRAALKEARTFKLTKVTIWDPAEALFDKAVTAQLDVVKEEREDSLSSLIVFEPYRANKKTAALPIWLNNEKLAWV